MVLLVVGAGNPYVSPNLLGTLASYFGERSLELRLYDPSAEMVDLFDRLARVLFKLGKSQHSVRSGDAFAELAEGAERAVLALDPRSAKILVGKTDEPVRAAHDWVIERLSNDTEILELDARVIGRMGWPPIPEEPTPGILLQISRYLWSEDSPMTLIDANVKSPFKLWLDGSPINP